MDYKSWIPILKKEVAVEYRKAPAELHSSAHQMDHLDRVWKRVEILGKKLGADLEVLVAAVYLHDIGRQYGLEFHGPESAKHAKVVLERVGFPEGKRIVVLSAIENHDYQTESSKRNTLEARILYDCDKLDAFGESGIKRYTDKFVGVWPTEKIIENIDTRWGTLMLPESRTVGKSDYLKVRKHFEALL